MKYLLSFFFLVALIIGCSQQKAPKTVSIALQIPKEKLSTVKVRTMNMLTQESVSLAEVRLDSSGKASVAFALSKPVFAWLETTNGESRLYIKPGYELTAIFPGNILSAPSFSGPGSDVNNYIAKCYLMERKIEGDGKRNINKLDTGAFLRRLDTLQLSMARFHQQYTDSVSMPEDIISILEHRNAMRILSWKQSCEWNYGVSHDFDIPERLKVSKNIPYDSVLLNSGMFEYAFLLRMDLILKIYTLLREGQVPEEKSVRSPEERIAAAKKAAFTMRDVFQKGAYPPFMKEFMLAKNLGYWRETFGLNPLPDTLYAEFKRQHPRPAGCLP